MKYAANVYCFLIKCIVKTVENLVNAYISQELPANFSEFDSCSLFEQAKLK